MIRQLLRIRRMVRQVGHHAPAADGQVASGAPSLDGGSGGPSSSAGAVAMHPAARSGGVGHSSNAAGSPGPQIELASAGLGGVTPWTRAEQSGAPAAVLADGTRGNRPALPWEPAAADGGWPQTAGPSPAAVPGVALPPAELPPSPADAAPSRSPASALARMVPRLDGFPSIFPVTEPAAAAASAPAAPAGIAPGGGPSSGEVPFPQSASAAVSGGLPPAAVWQSDLESLIARLEADTAQLQPGTDPHDAATENYIEAHVYLRLLYLIAGRQEQALAHIPGVAPAVQQFWQQMLWSMANSFDVENMPDAGERATQTLLQLHAASAHLQEQARLKLANVAFCTKITSFGNYDRFDPYDFSPGQPVLLYAEVENFHSEPTTDPAGQNAFRTILQSKIEILSPSGDMQFQMEFPPTEDLCRAHRRDYFHSYEFAIPPRIPYGHHVLVLTVEDRLSQKLATYRLNFTVK
jgi:hypothetical protein